MKTPAGLLQKIPPRARTTLAWIGAAFLGAVLLVAGWSKVLDPEAFAQLIRTEGLDFLLPATAVAFVGLGLEIGIAILLIAGVRTRGVLVAATGLVLFFLFLTGRTYWLSLHGEVDPARSCGCFGNLVERTPAEAFWQDVLLLVPALLLAWLAVTPGGTFRAWRRLAVAGVATAGVLGFAALAPGLDLDDLATRLKPGLSAAGICAGEGDGKVCLKDVVPDLDQGSYLFVIVDLKDPALADRVAAWNEHALAGQPPTLWVLTSASAEEIQNFSLERGATFQVSEAPASLLRPLHRRLPRSFRVEGGRVTETASGYPDLPVSGSPEGG